MFIAPPAPKYPMYYSSSAMFNNIRGEAQYNIEASNSSTRLGPDQSFVAPEGVYEARNVVAMALPTAHPSDPPAPATNPLAPTAHHPQTHGSGVRLSAVSIRHTPPPGSLEYNIQQAVASSAQANALNGSSSSSSSSSQTAQPQTKSRWTSSLFGSNSANRRNSAINIPNTSSGPSTATPVIDERKALSDPFLDPPDSSSSAASTLAPTDSHGFPLNSTGPASQPPSQKKKSFALSLASLNISNAKSSKALATPTDNHHILVSHQPAALIGTSVVPPDAIGTSPLLSNLYTTIPLDPHNSSNAGENADGLGILGLSQAGTPMSTLNSALFVGNAGPGGANGGSSASTNASSSPAVNTGKKKRPKSNLVKNNSTFISRTLVNDNLSRRLADRTLDPEPVIWANTGRSLQWLDFSTKPASSTAATIPRDQYLSKILFTKSHPLCHDVNPYTRSAHGVDVVVGMSSGDAIWLDSASNKYHRINKNGDVTAAAVTAVKWVPGSENLFFTLHANGTLVLFDKERDDGGFSYHGGLNYQDSRSTEAFRIVKSLYGDVPAQDENPDATLAEGSTPTTTTSGGNIFFNYKNKNSNDDDDGESDNTPRQFSSAKHNPLAVYKLSHKPLTSVEFSPDRQTMAITSSDGYLRFMNLGTEVVTDFLPSYYDGFLTCAFSPDGKYLATGGKDDLVTIWSVKRRAVVARGDGHHSWVRKVAFDPWNCDLSGTSVADGNEGAPGGATYRLGSVGDEGQLILWDFSPRILSRPKVQRKKGGAAGATAAAVAASTSSSSAVVQGSNRDSASMASLKPVMSEHSLSTGTVLNPAAPTSLGGIGGSATNPYVSRVHPFIAKDKVPQLTPAVQVTVRFSGKAADVPDPSNNAAGNGAGGPGSAPGSAGGAAGAAQQGNANGNAANGGANGGNPNTSMSAALMFGVDTTGGIVEPLTDLLFLEKTVVVASKDGKIWTWNRPSTAAATVPDAAAANGSGIVNGRYQQY